MVGENISAESWTAEVLGSRMKSRQRGRDSVSSDTKSVRCKVCSVESQVPLSATAYKCPNCGTQLKIGPSGSTSTPFKAMKVVLPVLTLIVIAILFGVCGH